MPDELNLLHEYQPPPHLWKDHTSGNEMTIMTAMGINHAPGVLRNLVLERKQTVDNERTHGAIQNTVL